jgi:hypothetical protein
MHGMSVGQTAASSFLRSTALLAACTVAIALLCLSYAIEQSGSSGPIGLTIAATVCFVCGVASEGIALLMLRVGTPLAAMLVGMAVRMGPPLVICLVLAAQGANGREHLAFIVYLLLFYVATLAVETWLAANRASKNASSLMNDRR